jgi:branched-chain amino acid aminotransferase
VIEILRDGGYEVREEELARGSMYVADEMFLTGTAAEVTPVVEIDDRTIGSGSPGPITTEAQTLFSKAVRGELEEYGKWLEVF